MRQLTIIALSATIILSAAGALADDAARCRSLRAQADRIAAATKTEGNFTGRLEREIGVDLCRRGKYAAGARELEKSIRLMGYQPD